MKRILTMTAVLALAVAAQGQQSLSTNVTVNTTIPDNNLNGVVSTVTVGGLLEAISSVTVSLDISGGYNGDYYAYLVGPNGGFAVLLNRVGVSNNASAYGYSDSGLNVTLSDTAANGDIHYYQNVPSYSLSGTTWAPDGANLNPQTNNPGAFLTAGQTAMLGSLDGLSADGQWVLFVADVSGGNQGQLVSWGLNILTVPEPQTWVLGLAGVLSLLGLNRWRNRRA